MSKSDYRTLITVFMASGRIMVQWLKRIHLDNHTYYDEVHAKWFYASWEALIHTDDDWCCTWPGPCIVDRFHDVRLSPKVRQFPTGEVNGV